MNRLRLDASAPTPRTPTPGPSKAAQGAPSDTPSRGALRHLDPSALRAYELSRATGPPGPCGRRKPPRARLPTPASRTAARAAAMVFKKFGREGQGPPAAARPRPAGRHRLICFLRRRVKRQPVTTGRSSSAKRICGASFIGWRLTRRSSRTRDWAKGRWGALLHRPFPCPSRLGRWIRGWLLRGGFLRPPRRGVPTPDPDPDRRPFALEKRESAGRR